MKFRFRDWLRRRSHGVELQGQYTVWDDKSFTLSQDKQGQTSKPDYDFTNLGLLFPQNIATEIVYVTDQMSHMKKLGSGIYMHVHYIQSVAAQPIFKLDYKFYNNSDTVPGSWTTISTADGSKGVFTYTSGSILQIASFPIIAAPTDEGVSANIDMKLYRDDNDVTGDVLAKYLDYHYEKDSWGSAGQFTKWTES